MYTYILHREYFLILRFEFSKFSRLKSWLYYYRTHARSKWEILQPSLDLTSAKKRLRKMQLGIILISQGGRIFFDDCSAVLRIFGRVCLFLRIEKSMKQREREKSVHENSCSKRSRKSYFWGYLFIFRAAAALFDQKSSIPTFNRFMTWHMCVAYFLVKKSTSIFLRKKIFHLVFFKRR